MLGATDEEGGECEGGWLEWLHDGIVLSSCSVDSKNDYSVVGELLLCGAKFYFRIVSEASFEALDRHNRAKAPRECLALDKSSISGSTRETFHPPAKLEKTIFAALRVCTLGCHNKKNEMILLS